MKDKPLTLKSLLAILDKIAPFSTAEPWDNVGLMLGGPEEQPVTGIMIALDPTESLLDEALARKANTVITHHPLIFHPLKSISTDQPIGRMIKKALANDLSLIACHTNLDLIARGVSGILAEKLGLRDCVPLVEGTDDTEKSRTGFGMIGRFKSPYSGKSFIELLLSILRQPFLQVAGKVPEEISTVALCGGSGSDLAEKALHLGAQVYLTAEVKHNVARWAEAAGFCVIDGGHFATEHLVVPQLMQLLQEAFKRDRIMMKIFMSHEQQTPFRFIPGVEGKGVQIYQQAD
jgi:dinuclear metal center YbgI/SA1388 family protein